MVADGLVEVWRGLVVVSGVTDGRGHGHEWHEYGHYNDGAHPFTASPSVWSPVSAVSALISTP